MSTDTAVAVMPIEPDLEKLNGLLIASKGFPKTEPGEVPRVDDYYINYPLCKGEYLHNDLMCTRLLAAYDYDNVEYGLRAQHTDYDVPSIGEGLPENWLTLDIETAMANSDASADPFRGEQWPYLIGMMNSRRVVVSRMLPRRYAYDSIACTYNSDKPLFAIGHNIKFDIMHLAQYKTTAWIAAGLLHPDVQLWDTSIAHYLLSGMRDKFPSLKAAACEVGLNGHMSNAAKDILHDYLTCGMTTQHIPTMDLVNYLTNDLRLTTYVAVSQINIMRVMGMLRLALAMMRTLSAVIRTELHGMTVDNPRLVRMCSSLGTTIRALGNARDDTLKRLMGIDPTDPATLDYDMPVFSAKTLETLANGGILEYTYPEVSVYKSGPRKGLTYTRNKTAKCTISPVTVLQSPLELVRTESGAVATDEKNLIALKERMNPSQPREGLLATYLARVIDLKQYTKVNGTYVEPLFDPHIQNAIVPECPDLRIVHPKLHQTSTATGRLSSSDPNGQNMPAFRASGTNPKALYVPRSTHGLMIEADYKQIEIVCMALRSGDLRLIKDIVEGVDIHNAVGADVFSGTMTKEERRMVKSVVFAMIYGAGTATIHETTGINKSTIDKIKGAFLSRYVEYASWRSLHYAAVDMLVSKSGAIIRRDGDDRPVHGMLVADNILETGVVDSAQLKVGTTGRMYWYETEYRDRGTKWGLRLDLNAHVKYTETLNHPIQGLATADIVPIIYGRLSAAIARHPVYNKELNIVMPVHDSLLFDWSPDVPIESMSSPQLAEVCGFIHAHMTSVPHVLSSTFGMNTHEVPFNVDISIGPSWYEAGLDSAAKYDPKTTTIKRSDDT